MVAPFCLFWTLWREMNRAAFDDEALSTHKMKVTFLCTLWALANLYSVDSIDSLVIF